MLLITTYIYTFIGFYVTMILHVSSQVCKLKVATSKFWKFSNLLDVWEPFKS
jgi:hypothetical protein